MQLEPDEVKAITTRLKRANGHLASVIRMLEDGSDCEDALTQLAAVNKAINRGGYALVATGLQKCIAEGGTDSVDAQKLAMALSALCAIVIAISAAVGVPVVKGPGIFAFAFVAILCGLYAVLAARELFGRVT